MNTEWTQVPLHDALMDVSKIAPVRLTSNVYQASGSIPIIDQGAKPIAGYWDRPEDAVHVSSPLLIFGDHTKALKFVNHDFCVGAEGVKLLAAQHDFDPLFLFYYLRTVSLPEVGYSRHFKYLQRVSVPKPPLEEQRKIAKILEQADDLQRKSILSLTLLNELARSLFEVTRRAALSDSTLLRAIGEFCTTGSGTTPSRTEARYFGGAIPWVKSGELRERDITATEETVTDQALQETSLKIVPAGTILLAMYGATIGRVGLLKIAATTNQAICHIRPDPRVADTTFMYYTIQDLAHALVARGTGGAQPNINQQIIRETTVCLPNLDLQKQFTQQIEQIDDVRVRLRTRASIVDNLFASLQHHAFAGTLTLNSAEETLASLQHISLTSVPMS